MVRPVHAITVRGKSDKRLSGSHNQGFNSEKVTNMKKFMISIMYRRLHFIYAGMALGLLWVLTGQAKAGLTFHLELDHNANAYYLAFPSLDTNSISANPPDTGYFVWSHSSTINSGTSAELDPDGTAPYNGGYFPDYNSLITEMTNSWTLLVTNMTSTNTYTFYVSYFSSNTLPAVVVTFPTDGATNISTQPTFTWTGPASYDNVGVQVSDDNGFYTDDNLPATQTSWPCPTTLEYDTNYTFSFSYYLDATASIIASTPSNNLAQPFIGWSATTELITFASAAFTTASYAPPTPPAPGHWSVTGNMNTNRALFTLTLLPNGKVLAAAGEGGGFLSVSNADLYDSTSGTWTNTGSLAIDRYGHTANLLGNGKVLVAGGIKSSVGTIASSELYDPASGTWATNQPMSTARYGHTATLLGNGKVLVVGGQDQSYKTLATAELYDPTAGSWTATGSMTNAHEFHTATLLTNGWVLIAGGEDTNSAPMTAAELYNPVTGLWTNTGSMNYKHSNHTATLLPDGTVLVAGGVDDTFQAQTASEIYNPISRTWSTTGSMTTRRASASAVLLNNGLVLMAGGNGLASAELYDPATEIWTAAATMNSMRQQFPMLLLANGKALAAGGFYFNSLAASELYGSTTTAILPIILNQVSQLPDGIFRFGFTNAPGANFTALTTTNLLMSMTNWNVISNVLEVSPGMFQFTDSQNTNSPQRFYRVRSP